MIVNRAAFHLVSRKGLFQAIEKERFLKAEREQEKRKLLARNELF